METAASIIAFVQITGDIVKLIIKVNQLWSEATDLPHDLQDLLEELKDYSILFEELKEQLEADNASNTARSDSCVARSFVNSQQAHKILKELLDEMSTQVQSKKEGFQRTFTALKLATKKEKLERFQKRLKRSIRFLNASIMTYQLAVSRRNADTIVSRVTSNFSDQLNAFELKHASTIRTMGSLEQNPVHEQMSISRVPTSSGPAIVSKSTCTKPSTSQLGLTYTKERNAWRARLRLPTWLSPAVYEFQSSSTLSSWSFTYRVYNIISPESEILQTIENGDKDGVLELFNTRKASPFDQDHRGYSLLYHAAQNKQYEICQVLLKMGLKGSLTDVVGEGRESPLKPLVYRPKRQSPESDWTRIVELFQAYLKDLDEVSVIRLFDFIHEWTYGDDFMFIFKDRFMPKYYHWPLRDRLEAVRLGSFHLLAYSSIPRLLSKDSAITAPDVSQSTREGLSLVHSSALALGIRYADETLPYRRAEFQWRVYNESWRDLVTNVASVADAEDLHSIELVSPWDVHHVPHWRGTALMSAIGGALCYLSPDTSFYHWDNTIQMTLHEWLEGLQIAGVDLLQYGERESKLLHGGLQGAFDADAIEASRTMIRETLAKAAYGGKATQAAEDGWNVNHWVPLRMIDLVTGPSVQDWQIIWAPEFEYMACQFWELVEGRDEGSIMPGSWGED